MPFTEVTGGHPLPHPGQPTDQPFAPPDAALRGTDGFADGERDVFVRADRVRTGRERRDAGSELRADHACIRAHWRSC